MSFFKAGLKKMCHLLQDASFAKSWISWTKLLFSLYKLSYLDTCSFNNSLNRLLQSIPLNIFIFYFWTFMDDCVSNICKGTQRTINVFFVQFCPYFSEWSIWSRCSATCGGGSQSRTRVCLNANPLTTLVCDGDVEEVATCNLKVRVRFILIRSR